MGARQHADLDRDRPDGLGVAAVDARLTLQYRAAHDLGLERLEELGPQRAIAFVLEQLGYLGLGLVQHVRARLFLPLGIGRGQIGRDRAAQFLLDDLLLRVGIGHVPGILGGGFGQFDDGVQHRLEALVAEHDGAEHDVLGQLLGLGFDHQHAFLGAGDDEVERRILEIVDLGIEHVLAVDIAHARARDRPHEGDARQGQRRRGTHQRDDVGIVLEIVRQHGADHLGLVEETGREQRPDGAVDEPRGQHLLLGRSAFALEESARDLAGGEGLFLVVDGQREEILSRLRLFAGDRGAQHRGLAVGRHHGAVGLARNAAGFEHQAAAAPVNFLTE